MLLGRVKSWIGCALSNRCNCAWMPMIRRCRGCRARLRTRTAKVEDAKNRIAASEQRLAEIRQQSQRDTPFITHLEERLAQASLEGSHFMTQKKTDPTGTVQIYRPGIRFFRRCRSTAAGQGVASAVGRRSNPRRHFTRAQLDVRTALSVQNGLPAAAAVHPVARWSRVRKPLRRRDSLRGARSAIQPHHSSSMLLSAVR
jgi:hypothetical protein